MANLCNGNCITCGKCAAFPILTQYKSGVLSFEQQDGYGIAIDIGTTTIVLALFDLTAGKLITRHSFLNPQRKYGPDVISRIKAANEGHVFDLHKLIIIDVQSGIKSLLASYGINKLERIIIAGNTTMTYLLLALSCQSLGVYPFKPQFNIADEYHYTHFFAWAGMNCPVNLIPFFTAFVGGDVLAGLLHVLPEGKRCFLLIDLGTNGEMALYDNGKLTVTSTAAGPAFEKGQGGASGIIHELAHLIQMELIDETGLLSGSSGFLSQEDVRNLQLAKSAVRSGLELLLETGSVTYEDLETVYLAGGIGQAIDINDAVSIGLIPPQLKNKTLAVGNASLGGAARFLLTPEASREDMEKLLNNFLEFNLAEHPRFNDCFMEYMGF